MGWREPVRGVHGGAAEVAPVLLEKLHATANLSLLVLVELVPPEPELVGELDVPHQTPIIPYREYSAREYRRRAQRT